MRGTSCTNDRIGYYSDEPLVAMVDELSCLYSTRGPITELSTNAFVPIGHEAPKHVHLNGQNSTVNKVLEELKFLIFTGKLRLLIQQRLANRHKISDERAVDVVLDHTGKNLNSLQTLK